MAFMVLITLKFEPSSLEESSEIYGRISQHHSDLAPNFAPKGWALCADQLLPISQYTALFSLLGTTTVATGKPPLDCRIFGAAFPWEQGKERVSVPIVLAKRVVPKMSL